MKRNSNLVTVGGESVTLLGKLVKPGIHAKNFIAQTSESQAVRLSDFQGRIKLISSVFSVDYDVCARQTRRMNVEASNLDQVQIITISCDLPFAIKRFTASEGIEKILVVSDHKEVDFGIKYGFLIQEFRMLSRGIIIIDNYEMVRYVDLVKEVSDEPDYDKAMKIVQELLK
jgi:thioredoxin-dependent peroxiredoxin